MRLLDLLQGLQYTAAGNLEVPVEDVIYDSRKVKSGCVFVCLRGARADGHKYAQQAAESGACAIVADHPLQLTKEVPVVVVPDTRLALAELSAAHFGHPAKRMKTVGVTGTKGKTTTTYMIRAIMEQAGLKTGLIGTIGAVIGDRVIPTENTTPESYEIQSFLKQMADEGCQCVVMEASSIGLKANRTAGFTFDIGLFTNFSPDHIGGDEHESLEEYLACKSMLFRQCKLGIVNMDDENWQAILKYHTCEVETYGFSAEAQLRAENEGLVSRPGYLGAKFDLSGLMNFPVTVDIPGKFSAYNALAAIAVCRHFPVTQEQIQSGLSAVTVKGRVEPVPVPGDYTLLIDYAHNAVSMENILETLREYEPNRLICLFGAGGNRAKSRRYEMGEVCGRLADLSVITADNSRFEDVMDIIADIKIGMAKTDGKYVVIPDRREAIRYCLENAQRGDVIVLAGKGHEDYQEIRGVKHPFDERVVVAELLKEIEKA
ncbi:UDP-N-acetylmuramoyl-L-alanyl-D-glutamate--2,6-diaminopimelate ligase [Clostridium merdae]|uniref:UDP-N-acetylmuramoyl-L-alanyl-D-glutamate--2, 6-diaminopimelate ligase n=1 Tax=Clostridium merdae TaxID=1958780 RepID=UPI000A267E87|nr:UDP-N-acetylmuramoyl-L-alanyl-D-glutamate--2,6-diaminopimelate ligase [Clostridium merdae]